MDDRERRLAEALRSGPRPSPPEGLDQTIKDEIPEQITPGGRDGTVQRWLVAATLIAMVGAGWLALKFLSADATSPVAVIAERSAEKKREQSAPSEPRHDLAAARAPSEQHAEGESSFAATTDEAPAIQPRAGEALQAEASSPASPPPPPAPQTAEPAPRRERVLREPRSESAPPRVAIAEESASNSTLQKSVAAPQPEERDAIAVESATVTSMRDVAQAPSTDDDGAERQLSYEEIREQIFAGVLPVRSVVSVDSMINHFDYGDRPPWRRGNVSVILEGGEAPFRPVRWRSVRVAIRSGSANEPIGRSVRLVVRFNPAVASLYRHVGTTNDRRVVDDSAIVIEMDELESGFSHSWLFEVKLLPEINLDEAVVEAVLHYTTPRGSEVEIERDLRVGHVAPTWNTSKTTLRLAALAGSWAEILSGERRRSDVVELLQRAEELRTAPDAGESVEELFRVIERTARLMMNDRPHP